MHSKNTNKDLRMTTIIKRSRKRETEREEGK